MYLIFLVNGLFASTYTIGKMLLSYLPPLYLTGSRMTLAGIILLTYQFIVDRTQLQFTRKAFFYVFKIGFFNIFLSYGLEFWALEYVTSIKTTFIYNLAPLITPLFSYLFFSEKMTLKKWIGLIIGFVGIFPVLMAHAPEQEMAKGSIGFLSVPEIVLLVAVVCYCYGWVFMRRLVREYNYTPVSINGYAMLSGGLMALAVAPVTETVHPISNVPVFILLFASLVIIGNLICSTLYTLLFRYYTITFVSFSCLMIPLFTSVYSYFLLGETLSLAFFVSMLVVFFGLYLFYQEELRQGYVVPRQKRNHKGI